MDLRNYEADFLAPGLPDTGRSVGELKQGVLKLSEEKKDLSPRLLKTEVFEYLLDNMRLGSAPDDFFPSFGLWGKKPYEETILRRNFEAKRKEIAFPDNVTPGETACFFADYAHSVPDWECILRLGFSGLLDRAKQAETDYFRRFGESPEKREFFQSVIRAFEAALRCMKRLLQTEERSGADPEILTALRNLISGRAETFYEALLQIWCYYQLSEYADCLQTRSFGNWDQMLYPYCLRDCERGVEEGTFRRLLRNYMVKIQSMHYYWGHPFYLGGTNRDGSSAVNELSYLILDEYDQLGIYDPKIQIKINRNTPESFLNRILDMIRHGHNSLVLVGEPCIMRTMRKAGYTEEEARTAVIKGCYEYTERCSAVETAPIRFILPKIVNDVLRAHPESPDFDSFLSRLEEKIDELCRKTFPAVDRMESMLDSFNPVLLFSGVSERALELGVDGYAAAPRHGHTNIWLAGPATAGDSLCAIRKFVFEKKLVSGTDLLKALDSDWQGWEELHRAVLADAPKFGNHDPEADAMVKRLLKMFTSRINGRRNSRGGFYTTALHAADTFLFAGRALEATPDGRRRGEEFSKNISPQAGRCRNGVTALIQSVLSLDSSEFFADFPLDVTLNPSAVSGEDGLAAMRSLVMTYIRNYGHAIHFNVFNIKQLEDAKRHPEKYPELQIRVCGWNVLWNNLSAAEQDAYLDQARANGTRSV
jgi:formate C-acetyltransferase